MNEAPKLKKTSHISYKDYKKKVNRKSNQGMVIFVSAFFMMLLIFLGIAKQITPDVDVSIGEGGLSREEIVKSSVDDRLKLIHMEDNAYQSDDTFSPELEEKVKLPKSVNKDNETAVVDDDWADLSHVNKKNKDVKKAENNTNSDINNSLQEDLKQHQQIINSLKTQTPKQAPVQTAMKPTVPTPVQKAPTPAPTPVKTITAKVIVGYYTSLDQAQVAKGIISEAGLNIDPFIKNIGGAYTIQTGSFTSKEKAQAAANELLRNNFPAKVIVEQ